MLMLMQSLLDAELVATAAPVKKSKRAVQLKDVQLSEEQVLGKRKWQEWVEQVAGMARDSSALCFWLPSQSQAHVLEGVVVACTARAGARVQGVFQCLEEHCRGDISVRKVIVRRWKELS